MAKPYEREYLLADVEADVVERLDFPSRVCLKRIAAVHASGTQFNLDVYNRAFASAAINIWTITDDGSTKCLIETKTQLPVKVDDPVTVAGSDVGGYNTTHVITAVDESEVNGVRRFRYTTDQTYTADGAGGTATLAIAAANQILHAVIAQQTSNASGQLQFFPESIGGAVTFVNRDPEANLGHQRYIYLKFSQAGTYRVVLAAHVEVD